MTAKKLETRLDMTKQRLDHGLSLCILTRGSGPLRCIAVIFRKKKKFSYQFRLVNAMHCNGPLTQVNVSVFETSISCEFAVNPITLNRGGELYLYILELLLPQ